MIRPHLLSLVLLPLPLLACAGTKARESPVERVVAAAEGFGERAGLVLVEDSHGDGATRLVYLDQGWGPLETLWYYFADQGSALLPYDTLVRFLHDRREFGTFQELLGDGAGADAAPPAHAPS